MSLNNYDSKITFSIFASMKIMKDTHDKRYTGKQSGRESQHN